MCVHTSERAWIFCYATAVAVRRSCHGWQTTEKNVMRSGNKMGDNNDIVVYLSYRSKAATIGSASYGKKEKCIRLNVWRNVMATTDNFVY